MAAATEPVGRHRLMSQRMARLARLTVTQAMMLAAAGSVAPRIVTAPTGYVTLHPVTVSIVGLTWIVQAAFSVMVAIASRVSLPVLISVTAVVYRISRDRAMN